MNHGLTTLRNMARHQGGADADPIPDAGPSESQPPADPADGPGPAAPPPGPAATPPPAQTPPASAAPGAAPGGPPFMGLREGHRMTFGEQTRQVAGLALRQARRNIREMRSKEGGLIHHLLSVHPPSVDDQLAYAREKRWVPPGHDDGIADKGGTVYQNMIAVPGLAFFDACAGVIVRPLRAAIAFFPCYVISALLLIVFGDRTVGVALLAGLAIAVITALIGLEAWAAADRRAKRPPPADDDGEADDDDDPAGYEPPSE